MDLKSGISKRQQSKFIVDEDALIRIKGVLEKAAQDLDGPVNIVFHVERKDDRFYETTELDEILQDPNMPERKISLLSIEIREDPRLNGLLRDWIVRIVYIIEKRIGLRFRDNDEIHVDISTKDKKWALLLADELEPQIERTINNSKMPIWPLFGIVILAIYIFINKTIIENVQLLFLRRIEQNFMIYAFALLSFALFVTTMINLIRFGIGKEALERIFGPESVFLWGEEGKYYKERELKRRNIFWGILVALLISILGGIIVTII